MDTYVGLSLAEIEAEHSKNAMSADLIPFARDDDGSLQCINGANNSVVNWEPEDKDVSEDLKMTYGQYLESLRDRLLMKKLMFEEGLGLYQAQ